MKPRTGVLLRPPLTSTRRKIKDRWSSSTKQALRQIMLKHKTCCRTTLTAIKRQAECDTELQPWSSLPCELGTEVPIVIKSGELRKAFANRKDKAYLFLALIRWLYMCSLLIFSKWTCRNDSVNTEGSFKSCEGRTHWFSRWILPNKYNNCNTFTYSGLEKFLNFKIFSHT